MKAQKIVMTAAIAGIISGIAFVGANAQAKGGKMKPGMVVCEGTNECKGQGKCAGKNGCGGNDCKGKGKAQMKKEDCEAKGGKVVEASKKASKKKG